MVCLRQYELTEKKIFFVDLYYEEEESPEPEEKKRRPRRAGEARKAPAATIR